MIAEMLFSKMREALPLNVEEPVLQPIPYATIRDDYHRYIGYTSVCDNILMVYADPSFGHTAKTYLRNYNISDPAFNIDRVITGIKDWIEHSESCKPPITASPMQ